MRTATAKKLSCEERAERDIRLADQTGEQIINNLAAEPSGKLFSELEAYMTQLRQYPTLTSNEDYAYLFGKLQSGSDEERQRARDLIVYGNIRLVLRVALQYTGRGLPLVDLLQEGVIGVLTAIRKFDITMGYRFSTYAYGWIRQAISRAFHDINERDPYRIPVHYKELMSAARHALQEIFVETGRWPNDLQVYTYLKERSTNKMARELNLEGVVNLMRRIREGRGVERLDAPINEDGEETLADILNVGPPKTETIVDARRLYTEYRKALDRIAAAVDQLPPREAMIVRLRFGLGDFDAMTLEEIGSRYELTRERIRQIEAKALPKLEGALGVTVAEIEEIVEVIQDLEVVANAY